jgi:TonB family protein
MNAAPESIAASANTGGWSRKKLFVLFLLAVTIHFLCVAVFGVKKNPLPRTPTNLPQLQLAQNFPEITALTDPTLFALPHENLDGFPAAWRKPPPVIEPSFHSANGGSPLFLKPAADDFAEGLAAFLDSHEIARLPLNLKPTPELIASEPATETLLPQQSILKLTGNLATRQTLSLPVIPVVPFNDVIKPTRVQVVVDTEGNVVSAIPLESSESSDADKSALELARLIRFAPAPQTALGELIFVWHTVPASEP